MDNWEEETSMSKTFSPSFLFSFHAEGCCLPPSAGRSSSNQTLPRGFHGTSPYPATLKGIGAVPPPLRRQYPVAACVSFLGPSRGIGAPGDITEPCNILADPGICQDSLSICSVLPDPRRRPFRRRTANSLNQKNRITGGTFRRAGRRMGGKTRRYKEGREGGEVVTVT